MIKFEYLRVSGCLEDIRVFQHFSDVVQVIMKIDGVLIPNFRIPLQIYEELEQGSQVEFYALVQNSKNKVKNTACGFHDTWTLSPRSFGRSFHAHLDRQSERSDAGLHC